MKYLPLACPHYECQEDEIDNEAPAITEISTLPADLTINLDIVTYSNPEVDNFLTPKTSAATADNVAEINVENSSLPLAEKVCA